MALSASGAVEGGRVRPGDTVAEVPLTGLSFYTLLTETCRSLFRTLSYPQILLKTLFWNSGKAGASPIAGSDRLAADW